VQGIWLPLITPFRDGEVDVVSLRRLLRHYAGQPIDGLILAATTGEGLTLDEDETRGVVELARAELAALGRQMPVFLGLCGSDTRRGMRAVERANGWPVDGYLITCPYYSRPSQAGLVQHFAALAGRTERRVLIYNIPYRTGVNLGNAAMLELAGLPNIVGVKDCCADAAQSFALLRDRPAGFAVMTGEDALFHTALTQGADGGILACAHIRTEEFAAVRARLVAGDLPGALDAWRAIADLTRLLFTEPNPAPIKHYLWRLGLIDSPELRLPMTSVSDSLAARIDSVAGQRRIAAE